MYYCNIFPTDNIPKTSFMSLSISSNLAFNSQYFFFFLIFWPHRAACGILVPRPGIKSAPPALEVWSPNHWT